MDNASPNDLFYVRGECIVCFSVNRSLFAQKRIKRTWFVAHDVLAHIFTAAPEALQSHCRAVDRNYTVYTVRHLKRRTVKSNGRYPVCTLHHTPQVSGTALLSRYMGTEQHRQKSQPAHLYAFCTGAVGA